MKRAWLWLWIALALVLVVRTGVRDRGVITDHLEFGRRLLHGQDLYVPYEDDKPLHPVYPPSFGLLTAPFALLPERAARFLWGVLQVLSLGLIGRFLAGALREVAPELMPRLQWLLLLTALLASRYILRDTHGGGGNLVNLALALTAFALAERGRAGSAALLLGFSLATKPTLLLLVPLLWIFGRRRAAAGSLLVALCFSGLALLCLRQGFAPLERWAAGSLAYERQADLFATPQLGFPPFTWMNQCLRCAVVRWLGQVPADAAGEVRWFVQGLGLPNAQAAAIAMALAALLTAITFAGALRWRRSVAARYHVLAATLALSLLLSPISWKAHHVALIPAFFFLWVRTATHRSLLWLIVPYFLLCVLGEEITGKAFKNVEQSLYLVTAGTLWLWGFCLARASGAARAQSLTFAAPTA